MARHKSRLTKMRLRIELLETRWVPTTITPTTFDDGGAGSGSLRDAVLQFNGDTGTDDDIIQLEAGTYRLTIQNVGGHHETAGFTGDLNLTQTSHRWIIQGAGLSTIIDASQLQDRVFQIINPGTQVVFQDLVIQAGLAQDDGSDGALAGTTDLLGGGILNNGGHVTLEDVVLQNNKAQSGHVLSHNALGGGLYSAQGSLTISHSALASNQANGEGGSWSNCCKLDGGAGAGGGLYAIGGLLTLTDSSVVANSASGGAGGGVCNSGGSAYGAGGPSQGGGLYVSGVTLDISGTTIDGNRGNGGASGFGCTPSQGYGGASQGGGLYGSGTLTITSSTIADNVLTGAIGGGASDGGGLFVTGMLTVSNSTIAANTVRGGDGWYSDNGGAGQGGGLSVYGTTQISFTTIAKNQATGGTHGFYFGSDGPATGGGLYCSSTLHTRDTVLAENSVDGPGSNSSPDLYGNLGSLGHNLVGDSQGGSGFDPTDLLDVDPLLGPLQNNGGPTETMALLPASPAIDAGDNTDAPDWDQRGPGYPRIVNGIIDIGAFEVQDSGGRATSPPAQPVHSDVLARAGIPPSPQPAGPMASEARPHTAQAPGLQHQPGRT